MRTSVRKGFCSLVVVVVVVVVVFLYRVGTANNRRSNGKTRTAIRRADDSGYFLAFKFYEQQTQAMLSLEQMQCLGSAYGLRIVEPFVVGSMFSFPLKGRSNLQWKLSDLIDIDMWNSNSSRLGLYPLVGWEEFLHNAPKDVVLGCIKYRNPNNLKNVPKAGANFRLGCPDDCYDGYTDSLSDYGFRIVHKSCSNLRGFAGAVTADDFMENLLGPYFKHPESVTVVLNEFRGFFGLYRMEVLSECGISHHKRKITVRPSTKVIFDVDLYVNEVLKGNTFAAILIRVERLVLHLHQKINDCGIRLDHTLQQLSKNQSISTHFVGMDVGRFGSKGAQFNKFLYSGQTLFKVIFKNTWSWNEWENSFDHLVNESAYVANFQRSMVARAKCLVLVGGGGFQQQALSYYKMFHPNPQEWCVHVVCNEFNP